MSARPDFEFVWKRINDNPARAFMKSPAGDARYGILAEMVRRFCGAFDHKDVRPGSRVVIVTKNEPIAGMAFLAAFLDGRVPVMLSPDSRVERIRAICDSVEPRLVVADQATVSKLAEAGSNEARMIGIPSGARVETSNRLLGSALRSIFQSARQDTKMPDFDLPGTGREPCLPANDDSLAYILFTSGTTKSPSGVQISRNNVMAHLETLNRLFSYDADSRIFNATPLAHTDGLVQGLLLAVANGATLLRPGAFSISGLEEWLDNMSRFEATHFITNPTVLALIMRFAAHDDYFDHERFFGVLSSASILRPSLWESFESRFGCSLFNLYGMTETVANATYAGQHPEMGPFGSIGIPVDCEVRLVGESPSGEIMQSATEGELQIRGENVFLGYWKNSERTARTLIEDGWMRTGDLARRGEDGGLEIIGRISTVINMGGHSLMPEEIDEALARHPAVLDVATVGLSDPEFEEVAVSAVVLELPASEESLAEHCRRLLEPLKVPKRIITVDKIPRGGAGKPITAELRKLLEQMISSTSAAPAPEDTNGATAKSVFSLAAKVFRVPAEELDATSSPDTVNGWDSFNHLNLMIEAEQQFSIRIPASRIASIRTLGDLHQTINANF